MDSNRMSVFVAAFLGAISASLIPLFADPVIFGSPPPVSAPARKSEVVPVPTPAPAHGPASSMDMDEGPFEICEQDEICDVIDDNDPIPI
jgi:hypothetical protein